MLPARPGPQLCTVLPPKNDSKERHSGAVCTRCWRTNCHRMKEMCAITVRNNRLHFGASTGYHSNLTHRNHHFCTVLLYRTTKHSKPAPNWRFLHVVSLRINTNLTSRYRLFRFALNCTTKSDHSCKLHHGASPLLPPKCDLQIPTFQVCTVLPPKMTTMRSILGQFVRAFGVQTAIEWRKCVR